MPIARIQMGPLSSASHVARAILWACSFGLASCSGIPIANLGSGAQREVPGVEASYDAIVLPQRVGVVQRWTDANGDKGSREHLLVGTNGGGSQDWRAQDTTRLYLDFDLGALPNGAQIKEAKLCLTAAQSPVGIPEDSELEAAAVEFPWDQDTLTWANQPSVDTKWPARATPKATPGQADVIVVTDLVRAWLSGELPRNGVRVRTRPEGRVFYLSYHSLDSGGVIFAPRLEIAYWVFETAEDSTELAPLEPYNPPK